ncbi:PulJ/GspJ family protein [Halanaerobacter jeridensis]|uniref:Prepilin-type N-terminal cleavage/methylation domain-containing protein n=1 Tax=Halanaerobacter jeridensis TaxID=706427 RepID=A0A938XQF7_9FIRM|nr:prepilin-type N-terminal cleavage/methylation domain-containing protein [Halanaerobacter jeridensis]MBM7557517.1 prepilin-type N-terminal cleavage/methylation domain-containing protein [Halanaerobacter jeridensis]
MNEAGFTLVEILAAVTITAIILVSLFALLQQSFDLWRSIGVYNHWEQNFRVLEAELTRDLHNLLSSPLTTRNLFQGSDHQIKFYQLSTTGEMKEITYSFDSYQQQLIKEVTYLGSKEKERIEFFSEATIKDLEFQFYDLETEYFKSYWSQQEVREKNESEALSKQLKRYLPQAIRLKIKLTTVDLPPLLIENFSGQDYGG